MRSHTFTAHSHQHSYERLHSTKSDHVVIFSGLMLLVVETVAVVVAVETVVDDLD